MYVCNVDIYLSIYLSIYIYIYIYIRERERDPTHGRFSTGLLMHAICDVNNELFGIHNLNYRPENDFGIVIVSTDNNE